MTLALTTSLLMATFFQAKETPGVRVAMIVPPEGAAIPNATEKLDTILKDVQWWYSCQMEAHGYGEKTFALELDDKGKVVVHTVNLQEPLAPTTDTVGRRSAAIIAAEKVLGDPRARKGTVMVLAYNGYYWQDQAKYLVTPMGWGANGRWAHLTAWHLGGVNQKGLMEGARVPDLAEQNPFFSPIATKVFQATNADGNRSVGERTSASIGTFLHEIGHSFGLHHPTADTIRVLGDVMTGDGFWNTRGNFLPSVTTQWCCLTPSDAALLNKNPLFNIRKSGPSSTGASRAVGMRGALGSYIKRSDFAPIEVMGSGFTVERLGNDQKSHSNRDYVWKGTPAYLDGMRFTRVAGGKAAQISVRTFGRGRIYVACVEHWSAPLVQAGFQMTSAIIGYATADGKRVYPMSLYYKDVKPAETVDIPQREWAGTIVIAPAR
jgi:hypothetical protein